MSKIKCNLIGSLALVLMATLLNAPSLLANPSFTRQTGLACNVCHTTAPELTEFGRMFKLNGYTMTGLKQVSVPPGKHEAGLSLNAAIPLGFMLTIADTAMVKTAPGTQNGTVELPQQLSLFFADAVTPHMGAFAQITYTQTDDHLSIDNVDIRYARQGTLGGKPLVWGLDVNNNPTVEDLWNSVPAWSFPFHGPDAAASPITAPLITGLGQDVAGLGAYAMWNAEWYGDFSVYRSAHTGGAVPLDGNGFGINILGAAPYWRVAWNHSAGSTNVEIGSYGIYVRSVPNAVTGISDTYLDPAADFQVQQALGADSISLHGTYIHERDQLRNEFDAGNLTFAQHNVSEARADAIYHWGNRFTLAGAYFNYFGTSDALLYPAADYSGSVNGSPDSDGYIIQGSVWPRENVEMLLQYTGYLKFNGSSHNYDGSGRNASDNNTVYTGLNLYF